MTERRLPASAWETAGRSPLERTRDHELWQVGLAALDAERHILVGQRHAAARGYEQLLLLRHTGGVVRHPARRRQLG